jgi:hypothetical protein
MIWSKLFIYGIGDFSFFLFLRLRLLLLMLLAVVSIASYTLSSDPPNRFFITTGSYFFVGIMGADFYRVFYDPFVDSFISYLVSSMLNADILWSFRNEISCSDSTLNRDILWSFRNLGVPPLVSLDIFLFICNRFVFSFWLYYYYNYCFSLLFYCDNFSKNFLLLFYLDFLLTFDLESLETLLFPNKLLLPLELSEIFFKFSFLFTFPNVN